MRKKKNEWASVMFRYGCKFKFWNLKCSWPGGGHSGVVYTVVASEHQVPQSLGYCWSVWSVRSQKRAGRWIASRFERALECACMVFSDGLASSSHQGVFLPRTWCSWDPKICSESTVTKAKTKWLNRKINEFMEILQKHIFLWLPSVFPSTSLNISPEMHYCTTSLQ